MTRRRLLVGVDDLARVMKRRAGQDQASGRT
jgi:hypothetical protein